MKKYSRLLSLFFFLTLFFQVIVLTYIVTTYDNPEVPIHFSFNGTADSFGTASEYYLLIGINLVIYILMFLMGRYSKVDIKKFHMSFKNVEEEINAQKKMKKKIQIFLQVIGVNISVFITILIASLLNNNPGNTAMVSITTGLVAFFISSVIIVIVGMIWINKIEKH